MFLHTILSFVFLSFVSYIYFVLLYILVNWSTDDQMEIWSFKKGKIILLLFHVYFYSLLLKYYIIPSKW